MSGEFHDTATLRVEDAGALLRYRNLMFDRMSVPMARDMSPGETKAMTDQQVLIALHKARFVATDYPDDEKRKASGMFLVHYGIPDLLGRRVPDGPIELLR